MGTKGSPTPRWSMIFSHHPPVQYERTLKLFSLRICARCFGVAFGITSAYAIVVAVPSTLRLINQWVLLTAFLAVLVLGIEIFIRNESQSRRSNNLERICFGFVIGAIFTFFLLMNWIVAILALALIVLGQFYTAFRLRRLGILTKFIAEYIEGAAVHHQPEAYFAGRSYFLCPCESHRHPYSSAAKYLESVREHQAGLRSVRSMRRVDARCKTDSTLRLKFFQSLASLRQLLSEAMVRSTSQRRGSTKNPLT